MLSHSSDDSFCVLNQSEALLCDGTILAYIVRVCILIAFDIPRYLRRFSTKWRNAISAASTMFHSVVKVYFMTNRHVGRESVDCRPLVDRSLADCWPLVSRLLVVSRPSVGR